MIHRFRKGHKLAPGGRRIGSGRKPDWFKEKCQELATCDETIKFLAAVVKGEPIEEKTLFKGSDKVMKAMVSASVDSRVHAWEKLCDRGFGKAIQAVEHTGSVATKYTIMITDPEPK